MKNLPPYLTRLPLLLQYSRNAFFSVLFPWACPGCKILLSYPHSICDSCAGLLKRIERPYCLRCGIPFPDNWRVKTCEECETMRSPVTRMRSVFCYEGLVRDMIRGAKYADEPRALRFFAEQLYLLGGVPRTVEALIAVPLHQSREWSRRYNQASFLTKEYSRLSGIPVCKGLIKKKFTTAQSSLSGLARRMNLKGAFEWTSRTPPPASVLLIDDVITTGATMRECGRVLRAAGTRKVYASSIARTLKTF